MGKEKIYEKDWLYDLLRPIVDWTVRHSYRRTEIHGQENLPEDGPFILAPNHCNTLMDALVMLRAYKGSTVFGARADMFNNRFVAKIMFFLRILPMVRQRDGLRNVLKNVQTQEMIVETLENDIRFCIFPEGRHRAEKSLLPLGKGVFRAALAANARFGKEKPVYIVPVGLEYGDFFRYRSTSLVTYGKPINVTEFIKGLDTENEAQMIEPLRKELSSRMAGLFSYIPDGEDLKAKWALTRILSAASSEKPYGYCGTSLYDSMMQNRRIIAEIEDKCARDPEGMKAILEDVTEFEKYRKKDGISIRSFHKRNEVCNILLKSIAALAGLPFFITSALLSLPMWVLEKFLRSRIKDKAFRNTASLGVKLGLGLIWMPAVIITTFCLLPWYIALAASLVLIIPSYSFFHDYIEGMRIFLSDIKIIRCKKLRKRFASITRDFNNL